MPTAHIEAKKTDFAETVLMPGDPLRSRFIAENFLEEARLINNVRGVQGYTGIFEGKKVSVMASGMGMPSMAIYAHELYTFFGVENIIRIGTIGALSPSLSLRDIVLAQGACTDSAMTSNLGLPGIFAPIASFDLLKKAVEIAEREKLSYQVGNILSGDAFYSAVPLEEGFARWRDWGILGVEMEAAALYMEAARAGKKALAVCTVSNHIFTGEELTSTERQNSLSEMIRLSLKIACEA